MKKIPVFNDVWLVMIVFVLSRIIISFCGIHLDYEALYRNWQYLSLNTLRHNLLRGVWFDHTQPPVFNLLLGLVLKLTDTHARIAFALIFKLISLLNALLLLDILKKTVRNNWLPLLFSLLYLISPATLLLENDLFYTTFISLMLLISCRFLLGFQERINWKNAGGFFLPLVVICLTRSIYHIAWLFIVSGLVIACYRKKRAGILFVFATVALIFTGSWYVKNYIIFNTPSTSSWMGMNIARNVFHDTQIKDSSRIEYIEPFSKISAYKKFLPEGYENKYAGLNDSDLLGEMKNDSFLNEKNVAYMEVSKKYMEASKQEIKAHPAAYLKNVLQSGIIFFAPATRYPVIEPQAKKIKYYDIAYSFNLTHFARGKQQRRIALTISAIPKIIIYLLVFFWVARKLIRQKFWRPGNGVVQEKTMVLQVFIVSIIGYIFCVSSLFEHYENMRFRYEAEPLFLILAAQAIADLLGRRSSGSVKGDPVVDLP